jgi:hypothetical protein
MRFFALVGMDFEVVEVSAVGLSLKVVKNAFDFVFVKGEVFFRLVQEGRKTVFDFEAGVVGLGVEGSGFSAHLVLICFVRELTYSILHAIHHS